MTRLAERIAIIGIGSPHGDDQFGWAVVDDLKVILFSCNGLRFEKINNPVDLIPSLDESDRVILVDAAVGLPDGRWFQKLDLANVDDRAMIQEFLHYGTHDVGVDLVLRMAESLGKRTDHVELWIGNAKVFERLSTMSPEIAIAAKRCAAAIAKELCDARTIVG